MLYKHIVTGSLVLLTHRGHLECVWVRGSMWTFFTYLNFLGGSLRGMITVSFSLCILSHQSLSACVLQCGSYSHCLGHEVTQGLDWHTERYWCLTIHYPLSFLYTWDIELAVLWNCLPLTSSPVFIHHFIHQSIFSHHSSYPCFTLDLPLFSITN